MEGEDRHRQAPLRHDGHARRLPVRRLGRREGRKFFRDLKANGVQVLSGNKQVATAVGSGQIAFGLTDTDDAMGEIDAGSPVAIVYPDREPDALGTLFIPNTLALIKGGAPREGGRGPGRPPAQPRGRSRLANGPSADPAAEDDRGLGAGRDAQDRPRDGGRLRGGGEALGPGRRVPGRGVRGRLIRSGSLVAVEHDPGFGPLRLHGTTLKTIPLNQS